jgi:hypothetical protein
VKAAVVALCGVGSTIDVTGGCAGMLPDGSQKIWSPVISMVCWTAVPPMTGWW